MSDPTPAPEAPAPDEEREHLSRTDADLARITEDLIDILIARGVIQFTDFPAPAQAKLLQRRASRAALSRRLQLLDDDQGVI
ncbi:hypothetical protein EDC36_10516 [Tepidimonas ignava]|uniref:Tryptophan synthase subunit beta n=1 Tax=Tepidimonas ignava TaxID=114249 RepID=A0A4R3LFI5_9BURK|nr:hypothetical protein [Tepidimonas ignava]TCS98260.1 hypothetical protein EDC36_10516 [Tepidimonas ignava]TSE21769.1 hypothetical protein Tigna_01496 [Tepidimonas ignava]